MLLDSNDQKPLFSDLRLSQTVGKSVCAFMCSVQTETQRDGLIDRGSPLHRKTSCVYKSSVHAVVCVCLHLSLCVCDICVCV